MGLRNRAHWIAGDSWMKFVQVWHISWAFVRRVRVSSWRRISSKISGIEKACLDDSVIWLGLLVLRGMVQ